MRSFLILLVVTVMLSQVSGFAVFPNGAQTSSSSSSSRLYASVMPKLDKKTGKYAASPGDDGAYPYGPVGSLLRHGPSPFFKRLVDAKGYEQDVLEYMYLAKVDRSTATGNMDAKLNNALDWTFQKLEEKKGAPEVDYTVLKVKDAILTTVWALIITPTVFVVLRDTFFKQH